MILHGRGQAQPSGSSDTKRVHRTTLAESLGYAPNGIPVEWWAVK